MSDVVVKAGTGRGLRIVSRMVTSSMRAYDVETSDGAVVAAGFSTAADAQRWLSTRSPQGRRAK